MKRPERSINGFRDDAKFYIRYRRDKMRRGGFPDAGMSEGDYARLVNRLVEVYSQVHTTLGGLIADHQPKAS